MSNMNNVGEQEITAFAKDYAELCKKHGLYLVFNDDVWLQYAGDEQDLSEVESDLIEILNEDYSGGVSLTELRKLQEEKNIRVSKALSLLSAFSPVLIQKTNAGTRIICEEGIKEELKNGRIVEISDKQQLVLDENGDFDIRNTGMV